MTVATTGTTQSPTTDTASITGNEHDPSLTNNTATAAVPVMPASDLQVAMTALPDPVYVAGMLTYTITVSNNGPSTEPAAVVTDTLPPNVTIQSASTSIPGIRPSISGSKVTANLGALEAGAAATMTIVVVPQPAAVGTMVNTAQVTGQNADSNSSNNTITVQATVLPTADLSVRVAGPATGLVGQDLVYTVTATNNGPSPATGVVITDTLPPPANVTFVSTSTGATPDSAGKITFGAVGLASGSSITYVITVRPTLAAVPGSPLVDTASVAGTEFDPRLSNNTAQDSTTVSPAVDLTITGFTASPTTLQIGEYLSYTVVVKNDGPSPATAVTVTCPLSTAASYVTGSGAVTPSGTVALQGSTVVAALGTLARGASATVRFLVTPSLVGALTCSASVTAKESDTNTSNNSATVSTTVVDRVGTIEFSSTNYTVSEDAGSATITVSRVNGARGTVTVDYTTVAINATPGLDFTPVSGTLTFPDGVTSRTIVVPVLPNPYDHRDELVSVVLSQRSDRRDPGPGPPGHAQPRRP